MTNSLEDKASLVTGIDFREKTMFKV